MNPADVAQRQLDAYNARDIDRFVAEFSETVQVYRLPGAEPVIVGRAALRAHYAGQRFNLPKLHAELLGRIVMGNKVIDHERITGARDEAYEAAAIYEVRDGLVQTVWFLDGQ